MAVETQIFRLEGLTDGGGVKGFPGYRYPDRPELTRIVQIDLAEEVHRRPLEPLFAHRFQGLDIEICQVPVHPVRFNPVEVAQ